MSTARLLIVTAPSGSGKTTIVRHLLKAFPRLRFSISATTRSRRSTEINGQDYYFISGERFRELVAQDAFAEGGVAVFDIDVKGAVNLKRIYGDRALAVFIRPPSLEVLVARLRARQTEDDASLERRIDRVTEEMSFEDRFDRTLVNDELTTALQEAQDIAASFLGEPVHSTTPA